MYNLVVLHQKIKDRLKPLVREHRGHFVKMANIFCKLEYLCYLCTIFEYG